MKIWPFDQFGQTLAGPTRPREKVRIWGGESAAGPLSHTLSNDDLARAASCCRYSGGSGGQNGDRD
ncbi:MAG: hypothetical protein R2932_21445 [Caldilineaceae bacterium]